jgi:hypothetical protein
MDLADTRTVDFVAAFDFGTPAKAKTPSLE